MDGNHDRSIAARTAPMTAHSGIAGGFGRPLVAGDAAKARQPDERRAAPGQRPAAIAKRAPAAPARFRGIPSGAALDDTALMAAAGTGNAEAFGLLVERHAPALYRVAARMLGDGHEAEDVVQECFTRVWQNAPRWKPSGAGLVGWLHRIAINLCFDRKRRFRVVPSAEIPDVADESPLADSGIEAMQARRAVAAALDALPVRYRAALVLCYYEGLTNALAAQALDLNIKAMESLLFRARRQMRQVLEAQGFAQADLPGGTLS